MFSGLLYIHGSNSYVNVNVCLYRGVHRICTRSSILFAYRGEIFKSTFGTSATNVACKIISHLLLRCKTSRLNIGWRICFKGQIRYTEKPKEEGCQFSLNFYWWCHERPGMIANSSLRHKRVIISRDKYMNAHVIKSNTGDNKLEIGRRFTRRGNSTR